MKKIIFLFLIFHIFGFLFPTGQNIKLLKIYDGDTILVSFNGKPEKIRFTGINTPEIDHPKYHKKGEYFGEEAKTHLKDILEKHKISRLEFDVDKRDKYHRLLAYIFLENGKMLNELMVEDGYAFAYNFPPNTKYKRLFDNAQSYAIRKHLGLWKKRIKRISANNLKKLYKNLGKYVEVVGYVTDTYKSKKAIYLNFGKNYKKDFTAVIFKNCWNLFKQNPASFYKYKKVKISGKLNKYNGPEIIISNENQIKLIKYGE